MSIRQLMLAIGGVFDAVALATPQLASSVTLTPTDATAQFELTSGGDVRRTLGSNLVNDVGDWVIPQANAGNYECLATHNSGTLPTGTFGSWLALTSTRTWTITDSSSSGLPITGQITVDIRKVGTSTVLATAVVNFSAHESF